jgi:hypothetical protein
MDMGRVPAGAEVKDKLGGRRFVLTCVSGAVATVMQWCGKLDAAGSTYALIILGTVAGYITGNVMERKNDMYSSRGYTPGRFHNDDAKDRT